MKIKELIQKLQDIESKEGNVEIYYQISLSNAFIQSELEVVKCEDTDEWVIREE